MTFVVAYRRVRYPFWDIRLGGLALSGLFAIVALVGWLSPTVGARIDPASAALLAAILYIPIFAFLQLMAPKTEAMREGRQALVADAAGIEVHNWRGKPVRLSWQDVDNLLVHADRLTFDGRFADGLSARVNLAELDIDGRELLRRLHQISGKPAVYRGELI